MTVPGVGHDQEVELEMLPRLGEQEEVERGWTEPGSGWHRWEVVSAGAV